MGLDDDTKHLLRESFERYHKDAEFHALVERSIMMALSIQTGEVPYKTMEFAKEGMRLSVSIALLLKEKQ